jgi:bifunctional non-homologous end joining protein LigD
MHGCDHGATVLDNRDRVQASCLSGHRAAVRCAPGADGRSDFNALHSNRQNSEVQLCAFDVLAMGGEDLRTLPLSMRKTNLERLLRGRPDGIFVNPFEIGAIGPDLFRAACNRGLEGLVSKRSDKPYRGGRSRDWIKVKNRSHPAMVREFNR